MRTLVLALVLAVPAAATTISELHVNYANGVPTLLGQSVTVSGVVTVPTYLLNSYTLEVYVQDETGGINVYVTGGASTWNLALGDSVTVTSQVAQYNGQTELGTSTSYTTIVNHGAAASPPEPLTLTCADVDGAFLATNREPDESRLVRLDNLNISSGDWPTTAGGNTVLTVSDASGSCLLYIDQDTDLNGSDDPGSNFSVIGVIKQYDYSSPYTSGYEIMPRYLSDVFPSSSGPVVTGPATISDITTIGAEFAFETQEAGSTELEYGATDAYGLTAGDSVVRETSHALSLTGLSPNSLYHCRAVSTNDDGTSYGPDQVFVTPSDAAGEIHVYFSGSVDPYTVGDDINVALGNQSLSGHLIDLIDDAETSVDACLYSLSLDSVRDALIGAHGRGCDVRLIIDQDNSSYDADVCAAAGIPYIDSGYGGNHASGAMHNKFVVIDARDTDPYNDWTWTGSANMSVAGDNDVNNALAIRDWGLAQAYILEFNEMWGSDTQTANVANARMGEAKLDDTPHRFTVNGIEIEQYMSPSDGVTARVVEAIGEAQHNLYFAMLAFTHDDISDAMLARVGEVPTLQIAGVFEQDQNDCTDGGEYWRMHGDGCASDPWTTPADVWLDTALDTDVLLHHKYMLVNAPTYAYIGIPDKSAWDYDTMVITGSHNWSYSAESINDENTLVLHGRDIANLYLQEFSARYTESGGTSTLGRMTTDVEDDLAAPGLLSGLRAWPNPFNPCVNFAFSTAAAAQVDVSVHDARGRRVRSLAQGRALAAGAHVLAWDGRTDAGRTASSGAYFLRVDGEGDRVTARVMLVR